MMCGLLAPCRRWRRPGRCGRTAVQPLHLSAIDLVVQQRLADARRAALVHDVRHILVAEVAQGGQHRVGRRLAQAAQGVVLDVVAQLFQLVQILHGALALGDLVQHLQQTLGADAAGGALAAGLSSTVNSRKNLAMSTMQVSSSMTIRPPEPIMEPMAIRLS